MHPDAFHTHDYSEMSNTYYTSKYLIFYVTHDEGWQGGNSNASLLHLLHHTGFEHGIDSGFEPLAFPGLKDDQSHFTLFRIETPPGVDVEDFYKYALDHINGTGTSCTPPNVEGPAVRLKISQEEKEGPDKGKFAYVEQVMLDWYSGASPHIGLGAHGPGGKPHVPKHPKKKKFEFSGDFEYLNKHDDCNCEDVEIYILDTIPNKCRIKQALEMWPGLDSYTKILAPYGSDYDPNMYETEKATYIYAPAIGQNFSQTLVLNDPTHPIVLNDPDRKNFRDEHQYDFSDHGLFIAGIIHSIAECIHLTVIQVISDSGVGTFWNFAAGFNEVARRHKKYHHCKQAIINCSFTLAVPVDEHGALDLSDKLVTLNGADTQFGNQLKAIIGALAQCVGPDTRIVAASGNDSKAGKRRMIARYPAHFDTVIGVGALDRDGKYASYSNIADFPASEGIVTFGGDYDDTLVTKEDQEDELTGEGIVSIFTGNLNIPRNPQRTDYDRNKFINPYGLAEWEGTSFSTPIVAAVMALIVCKDRIPPEHAYDRIREKSTDLAIPDPVPVEGQGQGTARPGIQNRKLPKSFNKIKQVE